MDNSTREGKNAGKRILGIEKRGGGEMKEGGRERVPMRGLVSGHVISGPIRDLEINFTGRGYTTYNIRMDGYRNY